MKKNISVNIFGTLYPIDEDAYELLQKYNENMRRYYGRMEDGDEIADDVEHRVAELLSELRAQGVMAITIEHVKEIINRIGDPQDLDNNSGETSDTNQGSTTNSTNDATSGQSSNNFSNATGTSTSQDNIDSNATKKLFRDPEDKILGGVLSGLNHYLGFKEPIVLRLLMIVITILSTFWPFFIFYIIAWILIPEACTPEDRLRMYGKPVSAKAINEEMMRGINNANNFVMDPKHRDTARGCLSALMKFVLFCFCAFFVFVLGCILLAVIATIAGVSIAAIFGSSEFIHSTGVPDFFNVMQWIPRWLIYTVAISGLLVIGLPLFGLIRLLTNNNERNYSTTTKVLLVLAWTICLGVCIGTSFRIAKVSQMKYEEYDHNRNTRNGVYLPGRGWKTLAEQGWTKTAFEGINDDITDWGQLPNGEYGHFISLKVDNNPNEMTYDLRQMQQLSPGNYLIEGDVRSDGEGNSLYVLANGDKDTINVEIPAFVEKTNAISDEEVIVDSYDGSRQWTHVTKPFEIKETGEVKFGISNKRGLSTSPWNSHKVEIANVKVSKKE